MIIGKNSLEFRINKREILIIAEKILGESKVDKKSSELIEPKEMRKRN